MHVLVHLKEEKGANLSPFSSSFEEKYKRLFHKFLRGYALVCQSFIIRRHNSYGMGCSRILLYRNFKCNVINFLNCYHNIVNSIRHRLNFLQNIFGGQETFGYHKSIKANRFKYFIFNLEASFL